MGDSRPEHRLNRLLLQSSSAAAAVDDHFLSRQMHSSTHAFSFFLSTAVATTNFPPAARGQTPISYFDLLMLLFGSSTW